MGWFDQFTLVMRSSITTLRERIEDPERMIRQLVIDMEEELDRVRHSVAGAIADEIQMRKRVDRARKERDQWVDRATAALRHQDEEAAKSALEQKVIAETRADNLDEEYRKQKAQTAKLQDAVGDLEEKIRQARQKQTLMLARLVRAQSEQQINLAMNRANSQSAFAQFSKLEQRVEREEAMGEAYDRLEGRDPDAEELDREFAAKEQKAQIEKEFKELKQRVSEKPE
jgi:phage shock protein A